MTDAAARLSRPLGVVRQYALAIANDELAIFVDALIQLLRFRVHCVHNSASCVITGLRKHALEYLPRYEGWYGDGCRSVRRCEGMNAKDDPRPTLRGRFSLYLCVVSTAGFSCICVPFAVALSIALQYTHLLVLSHLPPS